VTEERRLLQEADATTTAVPVRHGRLPLLAAAIILPVFAVAFYFHVNAWSDWNIQRLLDRSEKQIKANEDNRATLEELAGALERRLAQRDDDDGRRRFMLARIDTEFGRFQAALIQYRLLQQKFPDDPEIDDKLYKRAFELYTKGVPAPMYRRGWRGHSHLGETSFYDFAGKSDSAIAAWIATWPIKYEPDEVAALTYFIRWQA